MSSGLTPVEQFWLRWHSLHGDATTAAEARRLLEARSETGAAADNGTHGPARRRLAVLRAFPAPAASALPCSPHSERVAAVAGDLFDATRALHHLPPTARHLLQLAARLHDLAADSNGGGTPPAADVLAGVRLEDLGRARQAVLVAVLRQAKAGGSPERWVEAGLKPAQRRQARRLAALLQLADALDQVADSAARVEAFLVEDDSLVVRLAGPAAAEAARWGKHQATLWRAAFKSRLRFGVAPLSAAELEGLAAAPATADGTLARGIQHVLARRVLRWKRALEAAAGPSPGETRAALAATADLRQALAALQPALRRKQTRPLRAALRGLEGLLRDAVEWDYLGDWIAGSHNALPGEMAGQLQPLAEAATQSRLQAAGLARAWLQGPDALELTEILVDCVSTVPLRPKLAAPLRQAAQAGLGDAAAALAETQANYSAHDPATWRRAQRAARRFRAWLALLLCSEVAPSRQDKAAALSADLEQLVERLDTLCRIEAADGHLAAFLERWAVRQARRKAPQLHGAQAVLALRQALRRERQQQQRGAGVDWRPVRGATLRQRVRRLAGGADAAERPG